MRYMAFIIGSMVIAALLAMHFRKDASEIRSVFDEVHKEPQSEID